MNEPSKLIEKIISEASAVAEAEKKNAATKGEAMIEKTNAKLDAAREKSASDTAAEAAERQRRIRSVYALEHKKHVLAMKRDVLDAAFGKAVSDIIKLPEPEYLAWMVRLLTECAVDGTGEICVAKADDKRLGDAFLAQANAALKEKIGLGEVKRAADYVKKQGGFIYRKDGMEMDCSVEAVVALAREQLETDVAGILFGGQERENDGA